MTAPWFEIVRLDRATAAANSDELATLLSRIPKVPHTAADVMSESKGAELFVAKWDESLMAVTGDRPIGVLLTYVKRAVPPLYPSSTFYLAGLAVAADRERRGVASSLLRRWIQSTSGSQHAMDEEVVLHSVQTNAAPFNEGVRRLYESFGFVVDGMKEYDNRTDVVMFRPFD